jgi:deoxyribodipyrimidine photolyase
MKTKLIIYWSRRDFRLADNPALFKAIERSKTDKIAFLPLFIVEKYMIAGNPEYQFGYPSKYFLSQAIPVFASHFENFTIFTGTIVNVFEGLCEQFELEIFVNDDVHPDFYKQVLKLQTKGFNVNVYNDQMTVAKDTVSGTGNFYSVFSPFKRAVWKRFLDYPEIGLSIPNQSVLVDENSLRLIFKMECHPELVSGSKSLNSENILKLFNNSRAMKVGNHVLDLDQLTGKPDLSNWYWSEQQALTRFEVYLKTELLTDYDQNRNSLEDDTASQTFERITIDGKTSKMSLALTWGLVSARILKNKIKDYFSQDFDDLNSTSNNQGAMTFLSELIWREFYKYILFHRPQVLHTEFQLKYRNAINWQEDQIALQRFTLWIKGQTGYPAVDAAMNQIAKIGWMHNRSRMMVASILTKNLGIDWRWGQEYFRAVLIDMDEASNNGGWQWGASVGADPKPIRIFNPYLQAENYDKNGLYQNKWLSSDYNATPIIEHRDARNEAINRYKLNSPTSLKVSEPE